jgi:hypothetical protein
MKKNILYKLIVLTALAVTFTGCLNDSLYDNGTTQAVRNIGNDNFVEIHLTSSDNTNIVNLSFDNSDKDSAYNFVPIHLTSANGAVEDVNVTFEVITSTTNNSILDSLVNIEGNIIPTSKYTIANANNTVTIPKGSYDGFIKLKFKPSDFLGFNSVLGFRIKSVSSSKYTISNLSTGYVTFGIKNQYDGKYKASGSFTHPSLGISTFNYSGSQAESLSTLSSNAVEKLLAGDRSIPVDITITSTTLVVNGKTVNRVSINIPSYPGANGQTDVDASGNAMNYYDPATKTFVLFYWYNNAAHRIIKETLTYQGPR